MRSVFGKMGVFYCLMFTLSTRILLYTLNKPLLSETFGSDKDRNIFQNIRELTTPPVIAVLIGLCIYVSGFRFPALIEDLMNDISSLCFPLGMMLCGMVLAKYKIASNFRWKAFEIPVARQILVPLLALMMAQILPVSPIVKGVLVVYASLPVPSTTTTFAMEYSSSQELYFLSFGCVLWSTVLSTVTIPVWAALVQDIFIVS